MSLTDKFKEFATLFHIINDSLNETRETQTEEDEQRRRRQLTNSRNSK